MKNFKGADFGKWMSSQEEAKALLVELKEFLSRPLDSPTGRSLATEQRLACDGILRACNQQVVAGLACPEHLGSLLELAELACDGYLTATPHRSPLYLERILFVLLRNITAQVAPEAIRHLTQSLHACLLQHVPVGASQDYEAIARGTFSLLWKGAEAIGERQSAFSVRLWALSFLVLLEDESTPCKFPLFASPTACQAEAACRLFEASGHRLSEADACFLSEQLSTCVIKVLVGEEACPSRPLSPCRALCLLELTLEQCRRLCLSNCCDEATRAVQEAHGYLGNTDLAPSLQLCLFGVELQRLLAGACGAVGELLRKAAVTLGFGGKGPLSSLRALVETCQFIVSVLESNTPKKYDVDTILGFSAFLGRYCHLLRQLRDSVSDTPVDCPKQHQVLAQMHFHGLQLYTRMVYDFFNGSKVTDLPDLTQLVESCHRAVVWMLEALEGLKDQEQAEYLGITACCTGHLAYRFYSQKLYTEASSVTEPFCQKIGLAKPGTYPGVPPEKLHKCFRLHVESLKKLGQPAQGCKMVTLWLMALQPCTMEQMAEPISFWVRVKMDAAKAGEKELQLKTLRDSLPAWSPEILTPVLVEELRGYKAVRADTGQERFNVICDLLELSTEETPAGAWARATYLVELAQVLCYYDFAQHAECSALDAVQEALKLLESVQPECQATDQFLDDKAQALLWLYICTLEAKMQKGIEQDLRTKLQPNLIELETNDLNYDNKIQDDHFLYSSIAFNLAVDTAHSKCLDQALALWKEMLTKGKVPTVRCLQQTTASLQILASLCQLLAKPLQALETHLLLRTLSENLKDCIRAASASCHITRILLTLDCPSYAQLYLKEAESSLQLSDHNSDGYLLLTQTCALLQSQLYCIHKKVAKGLSLLLSVLRDSALQKPSKAWYLLRVQALQLVAVYLSLPSSSLSIQQWEQLYTQGWQTSEIALLESHKLLRSIILLLVGRDLLSVQRATEETVFHDYGENIIQKWQVLAEVLGCSEKLVTLLGRLGTVSEAKAFCLEALRLTLKVQCLRQCALFLALKGELELARNDLDLCRSDLEQVLFLLQSGTEFEGIAPPPPDNVKKIHPQKGQQQTRVAPCSELPEEEPFLKGPAMQLVATVDKDPGPSVSSPVLKTKPQPCPAFLSHSPACNCTLCTDPALLAVCLRWVLASAGAELSSGHQAKGLDLLQSVLRRCRGATDRLAQVLQATLSQEAPPSPAPRFLEDLIAQAYTQLALEGMNHPPDKGLWRTLETGLSFVASRTPHLNPWHASLLVAKALASLSSLSCCTSQLFGNTWTWQPPVVKLSQTSKSSKSQSQKLTGEKGKQIVSDDLSLHNTSLEDLDERPSTALRPMGRPCTPKQPGQAGPHAPFTVFDEELSTKSKNDLAKAPRVRCRAQTRLKVNFSDDEDDVPPERLAEKPKRRGTTSRGRGRGGRASRLKTDTEDAPGGSKDQFTSGSRTCHRKDKVVEEHVPQRAFRRQTRLDMELMRAIPEEQMAYKLDVSFEILRDSDEEGRQKLMPAWHDTTMGECEVVRRDADKDVPPFLAPGKRESNKYHGMRSRLASAPAAFGLSTLDSVYDSLSIAFRCVSHCPPSGLYAQLCRLLALCLGHRDPHATAFFVTESVSITPRHQLLTTLHRQLHKAQKQQALDVTKQLQGLTLQEEPQGVPFARLQHLFSFRTPRLGCFPQPEKESFQELLAQLPSGVTVCVLASVSLQSGTIGDTLLLTRLEKSTPPVTIQIPTAQTKLPLSSALGEFDAIQKEQKENSSCTEKSKWWTTRLKLDRRMEVLITSLEKHILGCWKVMLVPSTGSPSLTQEASSLKDSLGKCGWKSPDSTLLQVVLGAAHTLSPQDVQALAHGLCQAQPERACKLLQKAVEHQQGRTRQSNGHLVLVLDKDLQKLPWESIPSLRTQPVTRLPSLRFLLSYSLIRETQASSVLNRGVNPQSTFYILNPQNNLENTEERFRARFCSEAGWKGLIGEVPSQEQVQAALTEHDLYIYAGHGAGASFLDGQAIQRLNCRAVALLFGCSSAALAVQGNLEGAGIVLKYIIAGCPLFLGNLWDVTDRDIDRYTEALLQGWLEAGSGAPLLSYAIQARQAPRLKYLIGAAPVAYGLPVSLQ
ncbi:separin isoform X1 [Vombatus ursinus]|uniref:separin isoform X1 n=1 Tax=Vombatus ursinus TaxID=29139 RepID=UPI000FFDBD09|nr:separin isoform X1 [Vombatus ursinus]XP_027714179.1 separin isoform X1 [Vombatus ursinus]XP_027714180.1 separin isoform X1 [Vombatus ursinus]